MWLFVLAQVIALDIILSGDNAVVIAGAANSLPRKMRDPALFGGIALALVLRLALIAVAGLLIHIKIVSVLGGLFLFWVAYKMVKTSNDLEDAPRFGTVDMLTAVMAIVIADLSMSLDNIAAIAGITKGHPLAMVFGVGLSVAILGLASKVVAGWLEHHRWLNWVGAVLVVWIGLTLIV